MKAERERWAEALAFERLHGGEAASHIAARIIALAELGDQPGIARLCQIADKLDRLAPSERPPHQ